MLLDFDPTWSPDVKNITSGSHSRLSTFKLCKNRAKLAYVDRIPEPERALPAGKTEHPNVRGERVHTAAEKFVQGGVELVDELKSFEVELVQMRELHKQGKVSLEGEWAYDKDWNPVSWQSYNVWMRIKCDAVVFMSPEHAVVIDYKTGKRFGNEVKHAEQMQLYQLGAFLRYPKLKLVDVELWYTDLDELHPMRFRRDQGLRFAAKVESDMARMISEEVFPPNPSVYNCRWCPYKPTDKGGTGHWAVGV